MISRFPYNSRTFYFLFKLKKPTIVCEMYFLLNAFIQIYFIILKINLGCIKEKIIRYIMVETKSKNI